MRNQVVTADALSFRRRHLWDLGYRITGSVHDADEIVRECADSHDDRMAVTLAIDALKRRKVPNYIGRWLPSLVETGAAASSGPRAGDGRRGPRYDAIESGTFAFLRALEDLDPRERAVFVMVETSGTPIHDVASMLAVTSVVVRGALQNARRKMAKYEATHEPPTVTVQNRVGEALRELIVHLQRSDTAGIEKMLAPDAQALFDSGGEFVAPAGTVAGAGAVARLLTRFADGTGPAGYSFKSLNALPSALGAAKVRPRWASRFVVRIELHDRLVKEVHVVMATAKLAAVRFDTL